MTIRLKLFTLTLLLTLLIVVMGWQSVNNKGTKEQDTQTTAVTGTVLKFQDSLGTQADSFEMVPTGAPASVTVTIDGCMRGGKCNLSIGSTTSTTATIINLTMTNGPYDFFNVNVAFTGGTNPTLTFNRTGTAARIPATSSAALTLVASGTTALATGAIANGACATTTTAATGALTTDNMAADFNADPSAVTGYTPAAGAQGLTIYKFITSGNVNYRVCNFTAAPITPGAVTLQWRVIR